MSSTKLQDKESLSVELDRLLSTGHWNPHDFLGLHESAVGKKCIRLFRPGAREIFFELHGQITSIPQIDSRGLFEILVPFQTTLYDYRIYHQSGLLAHDPYCFLPTFGPLDAHLFSQGVHYKLYDCLGAHLCEQQGIRGVKFAVWAPSAKSVSLVADFNFWDGRLAPMRSLGYSGVWELFVPGLGLNERYKFEIKTQTDELLIKADPYANAFELRPKTACIVADVDSALWQDADWCRKREHTDWQKAPMSIYEVHLGSWKRPHGQLVNYREVAKELAVYCKDMGFTHVELMPIAEHPLDESWGYQVSGFFAPTSRFGNPSDFQAFVDHLHREGIGVIVDWVPAHFPSDSFALSRFDGTALYEHDDPRQGFHPHWATLIFNYGRKEVSNFLISSALFWLEKMHVDGLRVDAVASMLYLDYGRQGNEWIANRWGGNENLEAIEFLKHLNSIVHERVPGALMIAEESTAFTAVTVPVRWGGLGFDFKWNMGWMNDTLRYFNKDSIYRRFHHNDLTFGLLYAFSERFMLVLSHDEVVHGKGSLISKMPGDVWQKFANLRLLLTYMLCQPGKKMLFMSAELAQWNEWNSQTEIEWHLLQYPIHSGIQQLVRQINHFYLTHPLLWQCDNESRCFAWVDFSDTDNSVIAYRRIGDEGKQLLCVHHFTPNCHPQYFLRLPSVKVAREVFNSDQERFGGSGKADLPVAFVKDAAGKTTGLHFTLAPLATVIFEIEF